MRLRLRAEYLQQIPESTLAHQLVYPYRSDSESVHNQFDQSLWNNRMISYGLERQKVFVLGFSLSQNATSRRIHLERHAGRESPHDEDCLTDRVAPSPGAVHDRPTTLGPVWVPESRRSLDSELAAGRRPPRTATINP
ncbi:hypothetical protein ACFXBB_22695 [Streptomyces scopuliridis]|uniref:hypothetical protein n=1 Tax=Streptomyces scopuliridis TaxID=452529 RepID=UPI0036884B98